MIDKRKSKYDALDTMWAFLQMGGQKADYEQLKKYCLQLRDMMIQKTAGQRKDKRNDISFDDLDQLTNFIVLEAMCLVLSGEYEDKNND